MIRLKHRLVGAVRLHDNIYQADRIPTAFVLSVVRPRIYLPSSLCESEQEYIIAHEQIHIRRRDPLFRLIAYMAAVIHWFNPLVWIAFYLSGKDMEMSCDEGVVKQMGNKIRSDYSESLLRIGTGKKRFIGIPLVFGEGNTKERIKNILNYKKCIYGIGRIVTAVVVLLCIGCSLNRKESSSEPEDSRILKEQVTELLEDPIYSVSLKPGETKEGSVAFLHKVDGGEVLAFTGFDQVVKFQFLEAEPHIIPR